MFERTEDRVKGRQEKKGKEVKKQDKRTLMKTAETKDWIGFVLYLKELRTKYMFDRK